MSDYIRTVYVAEILGFSPRLTQDQADSKGLIRRIRHHIYEGSTRKMAISLGIDTNQIYSWLEQDIKPTLAWWLNICLAVKLSPREMLNLDSFVPLKERVRACQRRHDPAELRTLAEAALVANENPSLWIACERDTATYQTVKRMFPDILRRYQEKRDRYREKLRLRYEAALKTALASKRLLSVKDVAKLVGTDSQTLARFCPELTDKVGKKYRVDLTRKALRRIEELRKQIRRAVIEVERVGLTLTRQNVVMELGYPRGARMQDRTLKLIHEECRARSIGARARSENQVFLSRRPKST